VPIFFIVILDITKTRKGSTMAKPDLHTSMRAMVPSMQHQITHILFSCPSMQKVAEKAAEEPDGAFCRS